MTVEERFGRWLQNQADRDGIEPHERDAYIDHLRGTARAGLVRLDMEMEWVRNDLRAMFKAALDRMVSEVSRE